MSDKERLEIIKDKLYQMYALSSFDIKWLVERAKKYQALVISDDSHKQYVRDLQEENKRFRGALEFYADEENYEDLGHGDHAVTYDGGDEARQALKEEK